MRRRDSCDTLLLTADGYHQHYPTGKTPFQMMIRLGEEAGELESLVNQCEDTGGKRLKHGPPDRKALAKEVQDVIQTALSIARSDEVERALRDVIDQSYHTKIDEGYLVEPLL